MEFFLFYQNFRTNSIHKLRNKVDKILLGVVANSKFVKSNKQRYYSDRDLSRFLH
jgi:hypothetical protein